MDFSIYTISSSDKLSNKKNWIEWFSISVTEDKNSPLEEG